MTSRAETPEQKRDAYAKDVYDRTLDSTKSETRAKVAAAEARAQAMGDYGPEGVRVFEEWCAKQGSGE